MRLINRWYGEGRECLALRKHVLRADMRVYTGEKSDFSNPNDMSAAIKAVLTAAIVKGLDVIGIVASEGPEMGWRARKLALESGIDIWVVPGQEYVCVEGEKLILYLLDEPIKPGLAIEQVIQQVHQKRGFVMATGVTRRQAQYYNRVKGTPKAPDAIEIFNAAQGGYTDIEIHYPGFVNSGSVSANDLEQTNAFTLIRRPDFEGMGLMPEGEGSDYVPQYLQREQNIDAGEAPADIAQGGYDNTAPTAPQPPR